MSHFTIAARDATGRVHVFHADAGELSLDELRQQASAAVGQPAAILIGIPGDKK